MELLRKKRSSGIGSEMVDSLVCWIVTLSLYSGPGVLGSLISSTSGLKLTYLAEVKALKSLVRNVIAPERDLGHTDRALKKAEVKKKEETTEGKECEDCQ